MKDVIYLYDRPSPQKKWLEKEKDVANGTQYSVKTEWPNYPEYNYYRVGFDDNSGIDFIDFDGGPFLRKGCNYLNYLIKDIFNEGDGLKMVLTNDDHN